MSWSVSQFIKTNFRGLSHFGAAPLTVWASEIFPSVQRWLLEAWRSNGVKNSYLPHHHFNQLDDKCSLHKVLLYSLGLVMLMIDSVHVKWCTGFTVYIVFIQSPSWLQTVFLYWDYFQEHQLVVDATWSEPRKTSNGVECVSMALVKWEMHPRHALKVFDTDTG